jgi:hypothetical protein
MYVHCLAADIACCRSCSSFSAAARFSSALHMRALTFGTSSQPLPPCVDGPTCHVSVTWSGVRAELATLIHPASFPASMLVLTLMYHVLSLP